MRFTNSMGRPTVRIGMHGTMALAAAFAVVACGGGEKTAATDTTAAVAGTTAVATPSTTPATSTVAAAPITGKTIDIKMVGDAKGYRFDPANFTVKVGDGAQFTNVSGGPHQVTFWADSIPAGQAAQLTANMPNTTMPLTGPLVTAPNQAYVVSFAGLKPGVYHYYCTPHLALGMKGIITVQ
ncbi:MAG: plastocyanin/azurin family copper-binding protein [Gemmatimonadaceae bacterium]